MSPVRATARQLSLSRSSAENPAVSCLATLVAANGLPDARDGRRRRGAAALTSERQQEAAGSAARLTKADSGATAML